MTGFDLQAFLKRCEAAAEAFDYWVLDDARRPVQASSADWVAMKMDFEARCRVASTHVGDAHVSTVFLGIDHNHARIVHPELPPLLFETMVFAPGVADVIDRYATWAEAEAGHTAAVAGVEAKVVPIRRRR